MPNDSIEELRFKIIKKLFIEFPELKERVREYLREEYEEKI